MTFFRFLERVFGLYCDLRLVYSIYWATAGSDFEDGFALDERAVRVDVRIDKPSGAMVLECSKRFLVDVDIEDTRMVYTWEARRDDGCLVTLLGPFHLQGS